MTPIDKVLSPENSIDQIRNHNFISIQSVNDFKLNDGMDESKMRIERILAN